MKRTALCPTVVLLCAACVGSGTGTLQASQGDGEVTLVWEAENYTSLPSPLYAERVPPAGASAAAWAKVTACSYPDCITALGSASGGTYLTRPGSARGNPDRAVYRVRVPRAGKYYLWYRIWPGSIEWGKWGSVYVDGQYRGGAPWWLPKEPMHRSGEIWAWYWSPGCMARKGAPAFEPVVMSFDLTEGVHVLEIGPPGGSSFEEPDKLDMLLLTTDALLDLSREKQALPATPGAAIVPQGEPADLVAWEAEDTASTHPAFEVRPVPDAAGGKALGMHGGGPGVEATYRVRIPAGGRYYLWGRLQPVPNREIGYGESAGVGVRVEDEETPVDYSLRLGWGRGGKWSWERAQAPLPLSQGEVRLTLLSPRVTRYVQRVEIDQLLLTTDPYYVPARSGRAPVVVRRRQAEPGSRAGRAPGQRP